MEPITVTTRARALEALEAFVPRMGRAYATGRNFDHGPGRHDAVSRLSPYLRRRLLTEGEVVARALEAHGVRGAEKFIQEVIWRTYFKGWLERRPAVWRAYWQGLEADLAALEAAPERARRVAAAEAGETGIACFDHWARELVATGYLHNHARMWFASIWIFTLGLPWRVGADFFYRHLLDGDPASNTLGWRWVAGLHTRGKPYVARADNIARYTDGRFHPDRGELARPARGLEDDEPDGLPAVQPVRGHTVPDPRVPAVLLLTEEDCQPEAFAPADLPLQGVATVALSARRSPRPLPPALHAADRAALADALERLAVPSLPHAAHAADDPAALASWASRLGASQVVTPFLPTGPARAYRDALRPHLDALGIALHEWQRPWDTAFWPYATAGFFKVKKQIPRVLEALGYTPAP